MSHRDRNPAGARQWALPPVLRPDSRLQPLLVLLVLLGLAALIYGPALNLAFYEEDPSDFGEAAGRPLSQLFLINTSGLYYRPFELGLFHLLAAPAGYDPLPMHVMRLGFHVVNGLLLYFIAKRLWDRSLVAFVGAGLLILHPMAVHGVLRLTASQLVVTFGMLSTTLLYLAFRLGGSRLAGVFAALMAAATLLVQETGAVVVAIPLVLEIYLLLSKRVPRFDWRLLAVMWLELAAFLAIWLQIEKSGSGFLEESFSAGGAVYLLQAATLPFARLLAALVAAPPLGLTAAVLLAGLALLGGWYALRGRALDFGLLLVLYLGVLAPAWMVKESEYFIYAHRILYPGLPWAAMLWAGLLFDPEPGRVRWEPPRWLAPLILAGLAGLSAVDAVGLVRLHRTGSDLMHQIVDAENRAADTDRLLFVNVPDRFGPKRQPYPMGDWGMLVAPVSMDLSRYGELRNGTAPRTDSLTAWQVAAGDVEQMPYFVTTRGPDSSPDGLYQAARQANAVYLVDYGPSAFVLQQVGAVRPGAALSSPLASFEERVTLNDAQVNASDDAVRLTLRWSVLEAGDPDVTVFVHVADSDLTPVVQADGDALGGLLPLTAWQQGDVIEDRRVVSGLPPGQYTVIVGLYDRASGQRLAVTGGTGEEVVPGGVGVGQVSIP